jgi:SNF2 family DNA or RNA helicase
MKVREPLWQHQQESYKFAIRRERVFDTSDPGTGKTRVHLEVWKKRFSRGRTGKLLIIAPKSLLESAWGEDIKKFLPWNTTYVIAKATNRAKAFDEDADIYITNTDAVKWLADQSKSFWKRFGEKPTIIIDEITTFKHRSSARSKAVRRIAEHFHYRTGMTGTPNSNTVLDMWHQMLVLDDGELLGKSYARFRNTMCDYQRNPWGGKWIDKGGAEAAVGKHIAKVCIRHQFDACMDIPENHQYVVHYEMSPAQRRAYNDMVREAIIFLEEQGTVSAINEGALRTKLLQIASGAVYGDGDGGQRRDPTYKTVSRDRSALVADLVEQREYSVVFYNWKHQREELAKEFSKRGITYATLDGNTPDRARAEIVEAYQRGEYQVLAMHPKTGAHGLTLTKGRATIIASPFDEADFLKQAIHRIYRGGQTHKTETILVEARGCRVEQRVYANLLSKTERMENLLDILRDEMGEE